MRVSQKPRCLLARHEASVHPACHRDRLARARRGFTSGLGQVRSELEQSAEAARGLRRHRAQDDGLELRRVTRDVSGRRRHSPLDDLRHDLEVPARRERLDVENIVSSESIRCCLVVQDSNCFKAIIFS